MRGVYRRFFASGGVDWAGAVCRAEAAFRAIIPRLKAFPIPWDGPEAERERLALSCLLLPAGVLGTSTTSRRLGEMGDAVAARMLAVTTSATSPVEPQSWWMVAGRPLVLLESDTSAPDYGRFFRDEQDRGSDPDWLAGHEAGTVDLAGFTIPVWSLLYNRSGEPDAGRRLRLHLWRLHTEREVLRLVLAACIEGALDPAFPPLRNYLAKQSERLYRQERNGFPQRRLLGLGLAQDFDELVNESQLAELREILQAVSPGLSASVVALARAASVAGDGKVYITYQEGGQMTVYNESQHVSGGQAAANVYGDVAGGAFQGQGVQQVGADLTGVDLAHLARELDQLRAALKAAATQPQHDVEVAAIAEAQLAAEAGDTDSVRAGLAKATKWALGVASTIGTSVAAAVITAVLGG